MGFMEKVKVLRTFLRLSPFLHSLIFQLLEDTTGISRLAGWAPDQATMTEEGSGKENTTRLKKSCQLLISSLTECACSVLWLVRTDLFVE